MKMFVRLAAALLFCISFLMQTITHAEAASTGESRMFRVSAYYSPEPNQSRYLRGNYEAEIRLNGRGTNGADGTEVYSGMLAAPKNYPFGAQINLSGLGVGTVHDRGGAIVPAGMRGQAHDRIDVWMGRGETGLARALSWGMRTVEGIVYWTGGAENSLSFLNVTPANLQHLPLFSGSTEYLAKGATGNTVSALQKQLTALGFYKQAITGTYDESTKGAVLAFQLEKKVIGNAETSGAGDFGPKTKLALANIVEQVEEEKRTLAQPLITHLRSGLEVGNSSTTVTILQKRLRQLGYAVDISGEFDAATEKAVQRFQLDNQITSEGGNGFGVYGPQTHATLTDLLTERQYALVKAKPAIILAKEFVGEIPQIADVDTLRQEGIPQIPLEPTLVAKEFPKVMAAPAQAVASRTQKSDILMAEFTTE